MIKYVYRNVETGDIIIKGDFSSYTILKDKQGNYIRKASVWNCFETDKQKALIEAGELVETNLYEKIENKEIEIYFFVDQIRTGYIHNTVDLGINIRIPLQELLRLLYLVKKNKDNKVRIKVMYKNRIICQHITEYWNGRIFRPFPKFI